MAAFGCAFVDGGASFLEAKMSFVYPELLLLIFLLPPLWYLTGGGENELKRRFSPELYKKMRIAGGGLSRSGRRALLLGAVALGIVALARPVIEKGEIRVGGETTDLVVAFDISRSMFANDLYPNRLEMAKRKFHDLLGYMKDTRIAVIGFSSRAFLVAPLTRDYSSLRYLVDHMGLDFVSLKGTDMMAPLEVASDLLKERKSKALLLFTDGGDAKDFSEEIAYAKAHGITIFIYALGTKKGGIMKLEDGSVVRDANGDAVVTHLNPAISALASATGGLYMEYSLRSGDMRALASAIRASLETQKSKERTIKDRKELFYYPLATALLLYFASLFSLPSRRRGNHFKREGAVE